MQRQAGHVRHVGNTTYSNISPKELLNIGAFELKRVLDFDPEFLGDSQVHQHDSSVVSTSCKLEGELNIEMLSRWIERLIMEDGANLYRYKGVMAVKGKDQKFVFQCVGMLFSGSFEGHWKQTEKRESRGLPRQLGSIAVCHWMRGSRQLWQLEEGHCHSALG
jgi:G3E family GTPase